LNAPIDQPDAAPAKRQILAEVLLVLAVFFVQGADPVPAVNEPYYLGKAIHYWNPDWGQGDFFLEQSTDATHLVFYFTFGWLACWLSPTVLAWTGRVLTWALLAWAWRRLSFAVVPRRWCSILTAAVFVGLLQWCHFAGEWVVGGVEAKGFAYVLVLLGIEAVVRNRWNRAWLLFGAASSFHVLVGGWSAVAAGVAWIATGRDRPSLGRMLPAVLVGFLLSLPGLVPALMLNVETAPEVVGQAHEIYVYGRLAHHLAPWVLPDYFWPRIAYFGAAAAAWLVLSWTPATDRPLQRLRAFVAGAIAIAAVGAAIGPLVYYNSAAAAGLLRFYWFRLADVAIPLGVALAMASRIVSTWNTRLAAGRWLLAVSVVAGGMHLGWLASRPMRRPPPAHRASDAARWSADPAGRLNDFLDWRDVCEQVARSGEIPRDARFLTPVMSQTFKWYSNRSEVVNRKEVPQDAEMILEWWDRLGEIHGVGRSPEDRLPAELEHWRRWERAAGMAISPADSLTRPEPHHAVYVARWLQHLGEKYDAQYVLTVASPKLPLEKVCGNNSYVVYALK